VKADAAIASRANIVMRAAPRFPHFVASFREIAIRAPVPIRLSLPKRCACAPSRWSPPPSPPEKNARSRNGCCHPFEPYKYDLIGRSMMVAMCERTRLLATIKPATPKALPPACLRRGRQAGHDGHPEIAQAFTGYLRLIGLAELLSRLQRTAFTDSTSSWKNCPSKGAGAGGTPGTTTCLWLAISTSLESYAPIVTVAPPRIGIVTR